MTVVDEWAAYMTAAGASPATVGGRTRTIQALIRYAGVKDARNISRSDIVAFLGRNIRPWSRLTYWSAIRCFVEFLTEFGYIEANLMKGVPRPRTPGSTPRPITDETVRRLLSADLSPRPFMYVRLALYEGLRVHEIAKLRGEDFDIPSGWLLVTGKGGNTAPVPIHPEIAKLAATMPEFGWWFPSPANRDTHVAPLAVSQTIGAALRSIGSQATAHQLRDTAATKMQRQVKDIRLTQSMLRHRNVSTTMKYTGVADEAMQRAVLSLAWTA